ncbi:MAG: alpha-galactosidase [Actinobacteria bacterium]|nr:alpha-galactosidase [Actinomycetota bacterium]
MTLPKTASIAQAGTQVIFDFSSSTPQILHWGSDLGNQAVDQLRAASVQPAAHAELDEHHFEGIWRENARGFISRPALLGHRLGKDFSQLFELVDVALTKSSMVATSRDERAGLEVKASFVFVGSGVLEIRQEVKNLGSESYSLEALEVFLPLPDSASESMDFAGRWVKERQPHRRQIQPGTWVREEREGRSSHDYTILQLAMTKGANYQLGEVWSMGVGFSGNSRHSVERHQSGRTYISAGELLLPGEVILEAGETHSAPSVYAIHSAEGIDGISHRSYSWLRGRKEHPSNIRPRPLTLNVWEAVYFDHNLEKLSELADVAQEIGVERFVLDDGWFGSRRDDTKGLGDWQMSDEVWPEGLGALIEKVKASGMEFGLWFEGEMLNPDSDVYRAHPDWILKVGDRVPPEGRRQHVVDLTNPGAYSYILEAVDKVLSDYDIAYIKWDHNKFLLEPASNDRPAVHKQTLAIYELFAELKRRHPGLEIESCSSGGGRIDLGMAQVADRFWTSDCNDALERQFIQRYTQIAIPPEMLGSHIGPTQSHTTGRVHSLSFRAITALFGHAGLEWDVTKTTTEERKLLATWSQYYKANRELLHTGKMIRVEQTDDASFVHGVVSQDRSRALFAWVTLAGQAGSRPNAICFEGLDPKKSYLAKAAFPAGQPAFTQRTNVAWFAGVKMTGEALRTVGLRSPIMNPENALLIEIEEI